MVDANLLFCKFIFRQECIPVGCIPPAAVAVSGGCLPGMGCLRREDGRCLPRGCLPRRVCLGGVCPEGVSA